MMTVDAFLVLVLVLLLLLLSDSWFLGFLVSCSLALIFFFARL